MAEPKIIEARITDMPKSIFDMTLPKVMVKFDDSPDQEVKLFDYFPDEISFKAEEFIGLTKAEGHDLKFRKDKAYLQS